MSNINVEDYLRHNKENILQEWRTRVRERVSSASDLSLAVLNNSIPQVLDQIGRVLSRGKQGEIRAEMQAAIEHAEQRADLETYSLDQVIEEYHLLRRVLIDSLQTEAPLTNPDRSLINDCIDYGIEVAATRFVEATRRAQQESEEKYRLLVEGVKEYAIFGLDPEGHIISWNEGAKRIKGYSEGEILGRHFSLFYTPEDLVTGKPWRALREAAENGKWVEEGWRVRRDGSRFWASVVITALYDKGRLRGYSKVTLDHTERRRREKELSYSLQHARCILWSAEVERREGPQGPYMKWNQVVFDEDAALSVLPLEVPLGETYDVAWWRSRNPEDNLRMRETSTRAFQTGADTYRQEFRCTDRFGNEHWLDERVTIEAVGEGRWRAVGVCTDITDLKRAEQALQERTEALEAADRRKDQFLGMLAHELRNPLAPMLNALYLLERRDEDLSVREQARDILGRQVKHMARLIDDLLDVTRISRGIIQLQPRRLDLRRLVKEVVEDFRSEFEKAGLELSLDAPEESLPVEGDETRLYQAVANLLSNALKFTPAGGKVSVRAEMDRGRAQVSIRDTGIGIERDLLPHIFETFTQADRSLDRTRGGLGLGLALVKGLVKLHGGEVQANSDGLGRGAEFSFWLPLSEVAETGRKESDEATKPVAPLRILVIEDNRDAAESLRDLLEFQGHTVEVAFSGATGLEKARQFSPEVVLCDIGLPEMDGYAVAKALRNHPATRDAYLLAISGYGQEEDRNRSEEAGFDGHLMKPVPPEELQRRLERIGK